MGFKYEPGFARIRPAEYPKIVQLGSLRLKRGCSRWAPSRAAGIDGTILKVISA